MKKIFFIFAGLCLCAFQSFAQTRINVRLSAEAKVENNLVMLGDIARINGGDEKIERMQKISLGYAPNIGMTRELRKEKIALTIAAAGFLPDEFSLESPPIVRVRRAGQEISADQLRETVEQTILNQFVGDKIEARIVRLDLPEKIDVPLGTVDIRANIANVRNLFAPFPLSVEIRVNDAVIRRFFGKHRN